MSAKTKKLVWSRITRRDFAAIWGRGAEQFSPIVADDHIRAIYAAADRLRHTPLMGRTREDLGPGVREIVIFPTLLFYRVRSDTVEGLRVVDGRRNLAALFPSR